MHRTAFLVFGVAAGVFANEPGLDPVRRIESRFDSAPQPRPVGNSSRAVPAPLLGNGDLGVCLTGPAQKAVFWVTKNDFWHLKDGNATPLNFGTLILDTPSLNGAEYLVRQTLHDATTHLVFTGRDSTVSGTVFVAATANVMVLTLSCEGKPAEMTADFRFPAAVPGEEHKAGERAGVRFATRRLAADAMIPTEGCVAWRITGDSPRFTLAPGHPVTLVLAMATNFDQAGAVELCRDAYPAALETAHKAWWRGYWSKSFVEIPDADIMRRYHLSQYTMASASRNPKFPPAIIGPWATSSFGWCGYWMNYNHAAPFYALYSSNHIEQADPHDTPILEFMPAGGRHAREILNCRGVLYPVGIGPRGVDACGITTNAVTNHRFEKGVTTWGQRSNAAYGLVNMGQRWYGTYDKSYGRKIYPYAKAVVEFWEDYLTLENGVYHIVGESVHEGSGKNRNPVSSLGLVRNAFRLVLDLSHELDRDAGCRAKWQDILDRLADYPAQERNGKRIFILSEAGPVLWQNNTVHIQHIYPAGQVGLDSPAPLLETARNTIAATPRWHDGNGANSFFPAAVRVGCDPETILRELRRHSTEGMWPNGFSAGNPHGIENCSTVPNTINEMLMQSHEGVIRFFPVWPKNRDARFGTLRARGAFLVSAELKNGAVTGVTILSEKGRDCTVLNPWTGERQTFRTRPGEILTLSPE